ncbi:MAG: hypothetical protein RL220_1563 [Bacteroidota bacterium]
MNPEQRISTFVQLGKAFRALSASDEWPGYDCGLTREEFSQWQEAVKLAGIRNGWFTAESVRKAFSSWGDALEESSLTEWLASYPEWKKEKAPKNVGIIAAGNIPLVLLHDVISTVLAGHQALVKLSSDDEILFRNIHQTLIQWDQNWAELITIVPARLEGYDAMIATGSDNTSRYFEYYFRNIPSIIRKNRNSIAILDGTESAEELSGLGHDIFDHFGLGCRSVTKIYVPAGYDPDTFFRGIFQFSDIVNHNKYANNYDYNKAVWLLNREDLLDNGFILLRRSEDIASPTGSIYWEEYDSLENLKLHLDSLKDKIQCITGHGFIPFGMAQCPSLRDYADGVDTMQFLLSL